MFQENFRTNQHYLHACPSNHGKDTGRSANLNEARFVLKNLFA